MHGSATLSQRQGRRLVLRGDGWDEDRGCSRDCCLLKAGERLEDRSSRPHRQPRRNADQGRAERAERAAGAAFPAAPARLGAWSGSIDGARDPASPRLLALRERLARGEIVRERERTGELVHVDIKKLRRIVKPNPRVTGDRRPHTRRRLRLSLRRDRRRDPARPCARVYPDVL